MMPPRLPLVALTAALFACAGCASFFGLSSNKSHRSSSIVAYLYPGKAEPLPPTTIPVLRLPLRVGIAFVPSSDRDSTGVYTFGTGLSEMQKNALMKRVADEFKGRDYIQSIQLIPSMYLRAGGGFDNLDQIQRMLGVDVIALVAYDQVQFTNENFLSLSYWTVVGAYVVHGNKNDTQTLMETAVYDIASRHLLFRAGGASQVRGNTAARYVADKLRADSQQGFEEATTNLIADLKTQLEDFRERVKQAPGEVQIEHRAGYTGAGAFGPAFAGVLAVLLGLAEWRRRR